MKEIIENPGEVELSQEDKSKIVQRRIEERFYSYREDYMNGERSIFKEDHERIMAQFKIKDGLALDQDKFRAEEVPRFEKELAEQFEFLESNG